VHLRTQQRGSAEKSGLRDVKSADFIQYIKKNIRSHLYHQFYPVLAKIWIKRVLLYIRYMVLFHYRKIATMLLSCNFVEGILIFPTKIHLCLSQKVCEIKCALLYAADLNHKSLIFTTWCTRGLFVMLECLQGNSIQILDNNQTNQGNIQRSILLRYILIYFF